MKRAPLDLESYAGCGDEEILGLAPLAVGFLSRRQPFPTGKTPRDFADKLLAFCQPEHTVCGSGGPGHCPLEGCSPLQGQAASGGGEAPLGGREIRVLGEEEIYAAPALIYHYVTAHGYRPPEAFVAAVRHGPPAGSAEHRILVRTLSGAGG